MLETISLLGVNISRTTLSLACQQILEWVSEKKKVYVCVAPASTLVDANRDPAYKNVINAASMVTPDGMPVVWLAHAKGAHEVKRTYGPDLMRQVCNEGRSLGLRHFLYGSTQETLTKLQVKLNELYPDIRIAGVFAPSFHSQAEQESSAVIQMMNEAQADILWVGLGSPKQDFWLQMHRPLLNMPVMIGAGAAFDFISGVKPQAPRWMQQGGLEWLFRLGCEPRRLWRRYLIGNLIFIWLVIKDFFKKHS